MPIWKIVPESFFDNSDVISLFAAAQVIIGNLAIEEEWNNHISGGREGGDPGNRLLGGTCPNRGGGRRTEGFVDGVWGGEGFQLCLVHFSCLPFSYAKERFGKPGLGGATRGGDTLDANITSL